MNNETAVAVLGTVVVIGVVILIWSQMRAYSRHREDQRAAQNQINLRIIEILNGAHTAMTDTGKVVANAIQIQNESIAAHLKAIGEQMEANTRAARASLDPDVSKNFTSAVDRLSEVVSKHGTDIERFGDSGILMSSSCKKMADQISALRQIVYGGKRAEEFSFTADDPEVIQRANIESDVITLMQDHNMPRAEAEKRVRQMYATRSGGM